MRKMIGLTGVAIAGAALCASATAPATRYRITGSIKGPDSRWDLLSVDAARHRLYMARVGGVTAVDLRTGAVTPTLVPAALAHGVVPVGATGRIVATSAKENALLWFDSMTGKVSAKTAVGEEPDGVVFDRATRSVVSINAHDLTIVDVRTKRVLASVPLEGEPEFGVVDGAGRLYDNIRDRHEIAVIDLRLRKMVRHISLSGCEDATGLAYDARSGLLVSVCGSGVVKFVKARTGREVASIRVGEGADAVILDSARRRVFIPSGHSGTLEIISLEDAARPRLLQTIRTRIGTRTGAVDPATGRVYLPSADFKAAKAGEWPDVVAGTMKILVVSPA